MTQILINTRNIRSNQYTFCIAGKGFAQKYVIEDAAKAVAQCNWGPWNASKKKHCLSHVTKLLEAISGGDIIGLINDIVCTKENNQQILEQLPALQKYHNVLGKLAEWSHTVKNIHEWQCLQFVVSDFNESDLKSHGFSVTETSIATAKNRLNIHNDHIIVDTAKRIDREYPDIPDHMKRKIEAHYLRNSRLAANTVLKLPTRSQNKIVYKRHRTCSKRRMWMTFPYNKKISETTFYKYEPEGIGPPRRISDKCSYCVEFHFLNGQLHRFVDKLHSQTTDDLRILEGFESGSESGDSVLGSDLDDDVAYDPFAEKLDALDVVTLDQMENALQSGNYPMSMEDIDVDIWMKRIAAYRTLLRHRESNQKTQEKFDYQLANLGEHELLFLFDYKQNVIVGHCPEELHTNFR